jgi:type 1 fimbriae regulatory protein FimB/type 1 fimbriae regulatory protein FimE
LAKLPVSISWCIPTCYATLCGYKLASDGQDARSLQLYLGHKNIQHTVRYTQLDAGRFKGFWQD